MKKFRIIWAAAVVLITLVFAGYRINEIRKEDSSGPAFTCEQEELEVSIHDGDDVLLQGITAYDKKDGDVTSSVLVEKLSNFYDGGKRTATYAAFDSDNHITEMERVLIYTDYTSPRFELTGSLRFRAGETVNVDQIVRASDCLDGDISGKVKILMDSVINNRVTGLYNIEYEVTNSAGDTARLPIEIEIYQAESGEVELNLSQYLVYYDGQEIDYKDYLKSVKSGNMETPFEGVLLEGMTDGADAEIPSEPEEAPAEEPEPDTEPEEGASEEGASEPGAEDGTGTNAIPKSRVTVRSNVDTSAPGVYPVYFYYREDIDERTSYTATEVMYVVVE